MLTVGSLFSGVGGFDLGFERAGMRTAWFVERDRYRRAVLGKRWPGVPIFEDVREVGAHCLTPVDVLCGGFPCQDLSLAGKGAGLGGERSGLWSEFARLIGELTPRWVVVENVPALRTRGLWRVLGEMAALGYDAEWDCIPASAVGAPHRRDRIWIVAYPGGDTVRVESERDQRDRRGVRAPVGPLAVVGDDGAQGADPGEDPDADVVNADSTGPSHLEEGGSRGRLEGGGAGEDRAAGAAGEPGWATGGRRAVESDVGRVADELPSGLDGAVDGQALEGEDLLAAMSERAWPPEHHEALGWWDVEPDVPRVAHDIPNRPARLKALGDALVPQIAQTIGERIVTYERERAA